MTAVNAGARLDRLPISPFHYRIFWLVGAGMFFDGYDLYVAGGVLAATVQSKFSTVPQNLQFISLTFVGMTLGALISGFIGDKYGRRFSYQINLLIFGLASIAAAFAHDMTQLIACRFVQGLGLGAEIVVGYSTMTEFVPPRTRGRWLSMMAFIVVAGFPATALLGYLIIPNFGWRPMFVIAGIGSLIVWYLRKNLPESPRWLESQGHLSEAESLMQAIEQEASGGKALPPVVVPPQAAPVAATDLLRPPLLQRLVVGCWVLISINTLIFGFVLFLPQFFLRQGLTITNSLAYTVVLSAGSLVGCALGAYTSDAVGRRLSIIGASIVTIIAGYVYARFNAASDPAIVLAIGFILIVAIYVQTAILYGVYTPELFPTASATCSDGARPWSRPSSSAR
jgi:MFS transporter, putative metabolite:H+ symporter